MNRLAAETSPYLRQHRDNPVDWYPWGDDAFAAAREQDRPIFLSVGYSSCHWCHVMAHESFEDDDTAAVMNRLFVNVKVDREERPDVDAVYMDAVQALTGRGGWPMSVWLTPDGRPFYGGTYFPPEDRPGMPAFVTVCEAAAAAWRDRRDDVQAQAGKLTAALDAALPPPPADDAAPTPEILAEAVAGFRSQFDERWGGFGRAPKFPAAMALDLLARLHARAPDDGILEMLRTTLDAMAAGGMYDQLGGGFARYSTDAYWLVPHFEKMLYDNALLIRAYLSGYLVTGEPRYRRIVEETIEYVLRDLRSPEGGFWSAEDADSEGVEGKFYVWSLAELTEVAGDDAVAAIRYWGVTEGGNFVDPHTGFRGNVLHVVDRTEERPPAVERARAALLARRSRRVRPGLDDKVLLAWNALMCTALTEAAAAFDRADWLDAATANARFLLTELRRDDGRFLRSWQAQAERRAREGRARHLAYAEDYAALLGALCTLAEVDGPVWLDDARAVADGLLGLFRDERDDGFFTTGHDAPPLVVRQKDRYDNATPSANALAAEHLLRLAALLGEPAYEEPAREVLGTLRPFLGAHPSAFAYALRALDRLLGPSVEIAIVGPPDDARTRALRRAVWSRLLPGTVALEAAHDTAAGTPLLAGRALVDSAPAAFVCEHYACRLPVTTPDALTAQLDAVFSAPRR